MDAAQPKLAADRDTLWKQYQLHFDLYRHDLDLVVKINMLYYAVTGAMLSYYFANTRILWTKFPLLFPMLMSTALTAFFLYGAAMARYTRAELFCDP